MLKIKEIITTSKNLFYSNLMITIIISTPLQSSANINNWIGDWTGNCKIKYLDDTENKNIKMTLSVSTIAKNRYDWSIQYSPEGARHYEMYRKSQKHYILDEKNGIKIDRYLIDNELNDLFSLNNGRIISSSSKVKDDLMLIKSSFYLANPRVTKLRNSNLKISSFPIESFQNCRLRRNQ